MEKDTVPLARRWTEWLEDGSLTATHHCVLLTRLGPRTFWTRGPKQTEEDDNGAGLEQEPEEKETKAVT